MTFQVKSIGIGIALAWYWYQHRYQRYYPWIYLVSKSPVPPSLCLKERTRLGPAGSAGCSVSATTARQLSVWRRRRSAGTCPAAGLASGDTSACRGGPTSSRTHGKLRQCGGEESQDHGRKPALARRPLPPCMWPAASLEMHRSHRCRVLVSVYSGMYPGVTGADGAAAHCWVIRTAVLRSGLLALASARPQESSTAGSRVAGLLLIYGPLCLGKMFSSCLCNTFGHSHNQ